LLTIDPQAAELVTLRQQVFEVFFSLEIVKKLNNLICHFFFLIIKVQVLKAQIFQLTGGAGAGKNFYIFFFPRNSFFLSLNALILNAKI